MTRGIQWLAWLALALGVALMAVAIRQLPPFDGQTPSGLSCRALCGLSLIAAEVLGAEAGQWLLAALWFVLGMGSVAFGVKLIQKR